MGGGWGKDGVAVNPDEIGSANWIRNLNVFYPKSTGFNKFKDDNVLDGDTCEEYSFTLFHFYIFCLTRSKGIARWDVYFLEFPIWGGTFGIFYRIYIMYRRIVNKSKSIGERTALR